MTEEQVKKTKTPKVTQKDTKTKIWDAYTSVLKRLKEVESLAMKPEERVKKEKQERIVDSSRGQIDPLLKFASDIKLAIDGYDEVSTAIEIKQNELKELFGIEKEALSLAALIDSHEEMKRSLELEIEEKKKCLFDELAKVERQIKETEEQADDLRIKEEKEWKYNHERFKKERTDALDDSLVLKRKAAQAEIDELYDNLEMKRLELDKRKESIEAAEEELETLRQTVSVMDETINNEVKARLGKEKGMLEHKFEQEKKFYERDIQAKLELAEAKNQDLLKDNEDLRKQNDSLSGKLERAYNEIKEMAVKTVEGAGNTSMFNELKSLLSHGEKNSK